MKQYRTLLILAAVAVVLGGLYFWVSSTQDVESTGVLFTLDNNETISAIEISNGYGDFAFTPEDDRWLVATGDHSYRTNAEKMDLMIAALSNVSISRVLEEELPAYGLDNPQATVSLTTSKGDNYQFAVGSETASRSDVYLRDGQSGRTMVTTTATVAQFVGSLAAYRDKNVFTIDKENIRSIDYYKDGQQVISVGNTGPQNWFITYPFEAPARQIELNELVMAMKKWTVAGYPEGDDYAAMGLNEPTEWLVITDADGSSQRLELGAIEGTTTYVRTGEGSEVVKLYTADLDFSGITPNAMVFIAPLKTTVDKISSIAIQTAEESIVFEVEQLGAAQRITSGGKEIDLTDFSSVFFKYLAMNADGRDPGTVTGDPVATLTTRYVDGTTAELALYPRDPSTYYMLFDGAAETILAVDDLEQLLYRAKKALG